MSARLISNLEGEHDLQDDLESSIYVLLWTALKFSECSGSNYVESFMAHVINPQPYRWNGGFRKVNFLQTRNYLHQIKFLQHPLLDMFITELAVLFSTCYEEEPNKQEKEWTEKLKNLAAMNPSLFKLYQSSLAYKFELERKLLRDPKNMMSIFNSALCNKSKWLANDWVMKQ